MTETQTEPPTCKGRIYRARVNAFLNHKGEMVYQERMAPMRRKSCPGCEECFHLDQLAEYVADGEPPDYMDCISNGALYELVLKDDKPDWESGAIEGGEFWFVAIKEQDK